MNDHLVLICGESTTGKSASLMDMKDPENVFYCNCEAGKKLPFPAKFKQAVVNDPIQIYGVFDTAKTDKYKDVHTIVIDGTNFLMDMYESIHVLPAKDTQKGWLNYQQYFKNLMQQYVATSPKNVIFTAHTESILNEESHVMEKKVPVKGHLKKAGIEAFFSVIVATKRITLDQLKDYENPLLNITEEDEILGFKHVFQTRLTKDTANEKIRSPMGMWERNETFIDNNAQFVLNRLQEYYV